MGGRASAGSKNSWNEKHYDRVSFTVRKGEKDAIRKAAEEHGESTSSFIRRAVLTAMGGTGLTMFEDDRDAARTTQPDSRKGEST